LLEYTWDQLFLCIGLVVKPFDGGTRLIATGDGRKGGFLALFEPLVENEVNAQLSTGLVDLKNLLESRSTNKKSIQLTKTWTRRGVIYRHAWKWVAGATVSGRT